MQPRGQGGSLDPSQLRAVDWLNRSRKLFPKDVFERMQTQAIEKYGITELLNDPAVLRSLDATPELTRALLRDARPTVRPDASMRCARSSPERFDEITRRLKNEFVNALVGRRNRHRRSALKNAQNFDWRGTIQANLKNYDSQRRQIVIERPRFHARVKRNLPWDIILCVDQSGRWRIPSSTAR